MIQLFKLDRWWTLLVVVLAIMSLWAVVAVYQKVSDTERQNANDDTEADLYRLEQALLRQIEKTQSKSLGFLSEAERSSASIERFKSDSLSFVHSEPTVSNMIWLDEFGSVRAIVSQAKKNIEVNGLTRKEAENGALELARQERSGVATGVFQMSDYSSEISLIQPFYGENNQLKGFAKIQYSLQALFQYTIPDWFSRKYHLHVSSNGQVIYSTLHNDTVHFDEKKDSFSRSLNIHGLALQMQVQLYPNNQLWVLRALFVGMVFLLVTLLASLLALLFDMRRRRVIEKELMAQNNLRQAIEASMIVGIRAHAMDGTMIYANPAFCDMIGYAAEEILNIPPPLPYIPAEESFKLLEIRDRLLVDPHAESMIEIKMRKKSGEIIDTIVRVGPMYDENNKQVGWITSVEDVTERKRLELFREEEQKRLESVNHLISMGEMASAIAHELNQPLSAISGYATGLANYVSKGQVLSNERLIDVIEKVRRQAERAANVTRRVQLFTKQKSIEPMHMDVGWLIEQVIDFMELEVRQKGCYINNYVKDMHLPEVFIDNTMAQQILINVLRNAIDAMLEYNVVDKRIDIRAEKYSDYHVLISILDQGPGVPEEKVEAIFQAFYTTKTQGVGIGLNICRTMIESNGGRLWAKAGAHGGLFYLTIPIYRAEIQTNRE